MALTAEEQARITHRMEQRQRQKTIQEIVSEMGKLQEFVDKSEWDAFFAGLWWHGGGFFLIGEYFIGIVMFVAGYALTLYSVWLAIVSALSYIGDFERNWKLAGIVFIGSVVFDLVTSIWAAIMAKGVRERSRYAISILKEKCAVVCGSK